MKGVLIGFGFWGEILAKAFKKREESLYIFDTNEGRQKKALEQNFKICCSLKEILEDEKLKFLIIATPPKTHSSLVKKGLEANKNILVEKPFIYQKKANLFHLAKQQKKTLMVDYTYLYNPGFKKIKQELKNSKMISYESLRFNKNFPRADIDVISDLLIHDLSMLLRLIPSPILSCSCSIPKTKKLAQSASLLINGKNWHASIHGHRDWTQKIRTVVVRTSSKIMEFEETNYKPHFSKCYKKIPMKNKKMPVEIMLDEFFKRIKNKEYVKDFKIYNQIENLMINFNKSLKLNGQKVYVTR